MLKSLALFAVISLFASQALALSSDLTVSADEVQRFFEDQNRRPKARAITVVDAHAKLDLAFGFADGRYDLAKYKILKIRPNIYALGLVFEKKKGAAVYRQSLASYFWYDGGREIVFKDGARKKVYDVRRTWRVKKRKTNSEHDLEFRPHTDRIKVQLSHRAGTVYMTLALK
ncbi:hypothetical protein V5T82_12420 [Magnetovibrio sp. PR-2]|uniref:hypothetical protein n=1 Tax=Magnetovibrio sp. PR-2 TaxID=3120356 RepID=UPI002FCE3FDB